MTVCALRRYEGGGLEQLIVTVSAEKGITLTRETPRQYEIVQQLSDNPTVLSSSERTQQRAVNTAVMRAFEFLAEDVRTLQAGQEVLPRAPLSSAQGLPALDRGFAAALQLWEQALQAGGEDWAGVLPLEINPWGDSLSPVDALLAVLGYVDPETGDGFLLVQATFQGGNDPLSLWGDQPLSTRPSILLDGLNRKNFDQTYALATKFLKQVLEDWPTIFEVYPQTIRSSWLLQGLVEGASAAFEVLQRAKEQGFISTEQFLDSGRKLLQMIEDKTCYTTSEEKLDEQGFRIRKQQIYDDGPITVTVTWGPEQRVRKI